MRTQKQAGRPAAVAVILAAVAGCGKPGGGPPAGGGGGPPGTPVMAVLAVTQDVPVYIDEIGRTTATESVTVVPQVSGKITARHFADGADLKKGQPLFDIDPRPFQATLAQAEGQLKKDQAAKSSADWNVGQDTTALSSKAISEQQLHNDTATRDAAAGAIAVDEAMIAQAKLNVEYAKLVSPIDGRAGERLVDVGNVVNGGGQMTGTSLLVVNKVDPIYADFTVTEAELARVQQYMAKGTLSVRVMTPADAQMAEAMAHPPATQPAGVAPGTGVAADKSEAMANTPPTTGPAPFQPRVGKLTFLDNQVQDASGTVKLRAELPNGDHHFWPGQFVNVRLVLTTQKAVMVPYDATQVSQQGPFVYKVVHNDASPTKSVATQQTVTVGQRHGDLVVVDSGLAAGDKVVSSGFTMLQPGAPVMVVNDAPPGGMPPGGGAPPKPSPSMLKTPTPSQPKAGPQASADAHTEGGRL